MVDTESFGVPFSFDKGLTLWAQGSTLQSHLLITSLKARVHHTHLGVNSRRSSEAAPLRCSGATLRSQNAFPVIPGSYREHSPRTQALRSPLQASDPADGEQTPALCSRAGVASRGPVPGAHCAPSAGRPGHSWTAKTQLLGAGLETEPALGMNTHLEQGFQHGGRQLLGPFCCSQS